MSESIIPQADQSDFLDCYRGRQGAIHHAAYMRMAKVLMALHVLKKAGISLGNKDVFDYGFGAGTFYRYCPPSSRLFGVEIDPLNVAAVQEMLKSRGQHGADLQTIEIATWEQHPLLQRDYDVILCSHVLEHLQKPIEFLDVVCSRLRKGGVFVGLVPLNERKMDPHHVQIVFDPKIRTWARAAGLHVHAYMEDDPWLYWLQPTFTHDSGWRHTVAQLLSLGLGIPATLLGPDRWFSLSKHYAHMSGSKPVQAAFVLGVDPPKRPVLSDPMETRRPQGRRFADDKFLAGSRTGVGEDRVV